MTLPFTVNDRWLTPQLIQNHSGGDSVALGVVSPANTHLTSLGSVTASTSEFSKSNIITTTINNKSYVGRRGAAKKEMRCEELTDQMQNGMCHHTKYGHLRSV